MLSVKVTAKFQNVNECLSRYFLNCWTFLLPNFDCSVVVKVKVTEKVQDSTECSSWGYVFSCWTFYNQTWYGDATSWAKVSCKKTSLLSSSSGSQWGLIWPDMTASTISAELQIFLQPNLIGWHIIISWSALCKHQIVVFKVKITVKRFKTLLNLYVSYIFCTTDLLATKECVLIYYS